MGVMCASWRLRWFSFDQATGLALRGGEGFSQGSVLRALVLSLGINRKSPSCIVDVPNYVSLLVNHVSFSIVRIPTDRRHQFNRAMRHPKTAMVSIS
jgi:hypothetical protein